MRPTWILGLSIATALSAGCGGADQNNSSNGGSAGSATTTTTTTTDTGKGGTGGDTGKGGTGGDTGGTSTGGTATGGASTGGTGGAATGGTGGAGGCQLLTEDASKIGVDCTNTMCAFGYTCHDFAGITVTHTCILLCDQDCQCPSPTTCQPKSDKANQWKECTPP